jgi:hypothetical protein
MSITGHSRGAIAKMEPTYSPLTCAAFPTYGAALEASRWVVGMKACQCSTLLRF